MTHIQFFFVRTSCRFDGHAYYVCFSHAQHGLQAHSHTHTHNTHTHTHTHTPQGSALEDHAHDAEGARMLAGLAERFPLACELDLTEFPSISDGSVMAVVQRCAYLSCVNLEGCVEVSKSTICTRKNRLLILYIFHISKFESFRDICTQAARFRFVIHDAVVTVCCSNCNWLMMLAVVMQEHVAEGFRSHLLPHLIHGPCLRRGPCYLQVWIAGLLKCSQCDMASIPRLSGDGCGSVCSGQQLPASEERESEQLCANHRRRDHCDCTTVSVARRHRLWPLWVVPLSCLLWEWYEGLSSSRVGVFESDKFKLETQTQELQQIQ